jgi:hypothetical protein
MINVFVDAVKEYIKHLKNVMLNGGFIFIVGLLFMFLPLFLFIYERWTVLAIIWVLLSDPFVIGFLTYYFTDYKELKGGK